MFVGSGADELFAGYARHRTRFEKEGIDAAITVSLLWLPFTSVS